MEDVLAIYERVCDNDYPVVCMDEKPFQLTDERYEPLPMSQTNRKLKYDCEYERKGIVNKLENGLVKSRTTPKPGIVRLFTRPFSNKFTCAQYDTHEFAENGVWIGQIHNEDGWLHISKIELTKTTCGDYNYLQYNL